MQAAHAQADDFRQALPVAAARPQRSQVSRSAALDDDFDTPRALSVLQRVRARALLRLRISRDTHAM